jgi:RimJ/RimL family protein N-acetyltransferase
LVVHIDNGNLPMRRLAQRFGFELDGNSAVSTQAQLVIGR